MFFIFYLFLLLRHPAPIGCQLYPTLLACNCEGVGVSLCTPQTANPPSLLANVSWRWVSSQSPPPHLPRSQMQAEGGFKITTTPPPRSQTPAKDGFTQHHQHHPTFLTRKRELGVGFPSPTSNSTTPTLLARKCEPGVGINNTDNGAHKCEPGVGFHSPPSNHPNPTLLARKCVLGVFLTKREGPKRCQMHLVGPKYVFLFSFLHTS